MKTVELVRKSDNASINMPVITWANLSKADQDNYIFKGAQKKAEASPEKKNTIPQAAESAINGTGKTKEPIRSEAELGAEAEIEIKEYLFPSFSNLGGNQNQFETMSLEESILFIEAGIVKILKQNADMRTQLKERKDEAKKKKSEDKKAADKAPLTSSK